MKEKNIGVMAGLGVLAVFVLLAGVWMLTSFNFLDLLFNPGQFFSLLVIVFFIGLSVLLLLGVVAALFYGSTKTDIDYGQLFAGGLIVVCLVFSVVLSLVDLGINVISVFIPSVGAVLEGVGEVGLETIQNLNNIIMVLFAVFFGVSLGGGKR